MLATQSHTLTFENDPSEFEAWKNFVTHCTLNLAKFYEIYLDHISKNIPVYFFKFEDLKNRPFETLCKIFKFLLNLENIEGTNVERRI